MAKSPTVDKNTCIGCGACVATAGDTFKLNDRGKAEVVNSQGNDEETIQMAIDGCPVNAIRWEEE